MTSKSKSKDFNFITVGYIGDKLEATTELSAATAVVINAAAVATTVVDYKQSPPLLCPHS